ncbi:hypothetical protein IPG41_06855 [Candidatus Peregrinibacteria bacterium]|nr:MAG: hypothetical protein IPG41_06855 [Candidatus Peregrinibacteria bacterium]
MEFPKSALNALNTGVSASAKLASHLFKGGAILAALAGCKGSNSEDTAIQDVATVCPVDAHTGEMQYSWSQANNFYNSCFLGAEVDANDCQREEGGSAECNDQQDEAEARCQYIYMKQVNKIPLRVCGAAVFDVVGEGTSDPNYGYEVNESDSDGDGISTWNEFLMGYNPCSKYSFYSGECYTDGELDFDADGESNATDERPLCYGENGEGDPGDYTSDCI